MLKLILFVLPLGLDTFAASSALGLRRLSTRERLRISLVFSAFELALPVVGLLLGRGLGAAIGAAAGYAAAATLLVLGVVMLIHDDGDGERVAGLGAPNGAALLALGLAISIDELAIGLAIGLLQLPLVLAVVLIGAQAFVVAQAGLRLGARLGATARGWAERLAAIALLGLGALVLLEHLLG